MNRHTNFLNDWLENQAEDRHAWLSRAAEQIRQWKAEEAATQDNDPPEEAE